MFVCQGEQLSVTCSTDGDAMQWTVVPAEAPAGSGFSAIVTPSDVSPSHLEINGGDLRFTRTSTSPLVSVVLIDNVTSSLNGARLNCTHSEGMTSTVINVIRNGND